MNQRGKRSSVFSMTSAAALSLLLMTPALAQDGTIATVAGGTMSMTTAGAANFASRSILGVNQTTTAPLEAFRVSDLTGSGAGWHVTAQATQFKGVTHDLDAGSLSLSQPSVTSDGTSSPMPTVLAGPYTVDTGAAAIARAVENEGMGVYEFGATTLTLVLPADVLPDVYSSTVTLSVIRAP